MQGLVLSHDEEAALTKCMQGAQYPLGVSVMLAVYCRIRQHSFLQVVECS